MLDKLCFQSDEVIQILRKTDINDDYSKKKMNSAVTKKTKADYNAILRTHEGANDQQTFTYDWKEKRSAVCKGLNCKKVLQTGTPCVKVNGALSVPPGKDYAIKQDFYFCPIRFCITHPPVWSNVKHPDVLIKDVNISDSEFDLLKNDLYLNHISL